jgi:hypothetical protein
MTASVLFAHWCGENVLLSWEASFAGDVSQSMVTNGVLAAVQARRELASQRVLVK